MKQINTALKTLAMKARVYNQIRKDLYKKRLDSFTDKQKVEFFDKVFALNNETHWELLAYKEKRKDAKKLYEERVARGHKFKKKTSKQEYLNSQK
jgi:hypothetical protein